MFIGFAKYLRNISANVKNNAVHLPTAAFPRLSQCHLDTLGESQRMNELLFQLLTLLWNVDVTLTLNNCTPCTHTIGYIDHSNHLRPLETALHMENAIRMLKSLSTLKKLWSYFRTCKGLKNSTTNCKICWLVYQTALKSLYVLHCTLDQKITNLNKSPPPFFVLGQTLDAQHKCLLRTDSVCTSSNKIDQSI